MNRRTIVAFLILTMSFSAFASVKYYRSTTDIPFVEMMINMMVAMGMLDRVPMGGYGAYPSRYGSPYSRLGNQGYSPWGASPWGGMGALPMQGATPWMMSGPGMSPWGGSPMGGTPWGGSPWGGSPMSGTPWGGSPWGGSPMGGTPWGGSPWGGSPMGGAPWGGSPVSGSPWGGSPWGNSPWGRTPYGSGLPWSSPLVASPWGPGYGNRGVSPTLYNNRWGRRLPVAAYASPTPYPVAGQHRRVSDPLLTESGFCPGGVCDRLQAKKALEGVWRNESGETLSIKDNRFDWSDGPDRHLSGDMHATTKDLVATVDDYDMEIRYRYMVKNNQLTTRDDKGVTRVFHREPEFKGEKL